MLISAGFNEVHFEQVDIDSFDKFCEIITTKNWSPGVYKDNYRLKANFLEASCVGLDIDSGCTLTEAKELFKDFKHIIATTKSHQIEKHGLICDRFRVILFLNRKASKVELEATLRFLMSKYKFLDEQCKDAARFFYPCKRIENIRKHGEEVQVQEASDVPPKVTTAAGLSSSLASLTSEQKGKLARSTLEFMLEGAQPGTWNSRLFKAAKDFQEQGYSLEDFTQRAELITGHLDEKDLTSIQSAWNNEPLYEPRLVSQTEAKLLLSGVTGEAEDFVVKPSSLLQGSMSYLQNKDLVQGQPTYLEGLDELLGGGKRLGEVTALCAEGKTGKNAIWHYLMYLWIEKNIPFAYASRELTPETEVLPDWLSMKFKENARLIELNENRINSYNSFISGLDSSVSFAKGRGYFPMAHVDSWIESLKNKGVNYFWFDHLHWCLDDPEDYKAASLLSRQLKDSAVRYNVHIDVIIQPKVLMDGQKPSLNSMKGGSAIGQNIDNFVTLERIGEHRENLSKLTLKAKRSRLAKLGSIVLQYNEETLELSEMIEAPAEELSEGPSLKLLSIE